jgi:hypothetical protein
MRSSVRVFTATIKTVVEQVPSGANDRKETLPAPMAMRASECARCPICTTTADYRSACAHTPRSRGRGILCLAVRGLSARVCSQKVVTCALGVWWQRRALLYYSSTRRLVCAAIPPAHTHTNACSIMRALGRSTRRSAHNYTHAHSCPFNLQLRTRATHRESATGLRSVSTGFSNARQNWLYVCSPTD